MTLGAATAGTGLTVAVTSNLEHITFTLSGSNYTETWTCDPAQLQVSWDALGRPAEDYLEPERYGACHSIVEHSSTGEPNNLFNLQATATWTFTYSINGSAAIPIPGTVTKTSDHPIDAVEILVIED